MMAYEYSSDFDKLKFGNQCHYWLYLLVGIDCEQRHPMNLQCVCGS